MEKQLMAVALLTEEDLERIIERVARRVLQEASAAEVLSTAAAARYAERSEETVRRWIEDGALPAQKRGRSWAIKKSDLNRYLAGVTPEGATVQGVLACLEKKK